MIGGGSLSLSGLGLFFPDDLTPFAGTFKILNSFRVAFSTGLSSLWKTQYALMWHGIAGLVMIVIIIGHVYIGFLGMEARLTQSVLVKLISTGQRNIIIYGLKRMGPRVTRAHPQKLRNKAGFYRRKMEGILSWHHGRRSSYTCCWCRFRKHKYSWGWTIPYLINTRIVN